MARYNAWMNERLYEACSHVSDADRKRDHRGQVTTLLMQLGTDPGVTDLLMLPELQTS